MSDPNPSPTARPPLGAQWPSVNALAAPAVARLLDEADRLRLKVSEGPRGVRIIDAGIACTGSVAAGLQIAGICLGGLGDVQLQAEPQAAWPSRVQVRSSQPVLACLGSQYAGWSLAASKAETGDRRFFALGSGPARALAAREDLFTELGYRDSATQGVLVLEVDRPPPALIVDKLLRDCQLAPEALTLILTPTTSLAGTTQVVARVLEVALHKAHQLGFALGDIVEGVASAPLPSPSANAAVAMGRTNDAILYGGRVHLSVTGEEDAARALADRLPSCRSPDHGRGFAELFAAADHDFYKIDPALFAPAQVWVSHLDSGRTWAAGEARLDLLQTLWLEPN